MCDCGYEPEDSVHFFTKCILYNIYRVDLIDDLKHILRKIKPIPALPDELTLIYLYGNSQLTKSENKQILKASIKFIYNSGRFQ